MTMTSGAITSGALIYSGYTGTLEVPDGMVAVQCVEESISTNRSTDRRAWAINPESLASYYRERAEHYMRLAEDAQTERE